MKRLGKRAAAAEAYLDTVYALLSAPCRAWAELPAIRVQWLPFALSHVRLAAGGMSFQPPTDLAEAIDMVWKEATPS